MENVKTNKIKHIRTLNKNNLLTAKKENKSIGCGECQASCQSACKTSCTVANQKCENK
jgi:predicted ribosomally synthesized six-cysteine peptide SCIFF